MFLKNILRSFSSLTPSPTCSRTADRSHHLLTLYDQEFNVCRRTSKKCQKVARDQWKREATYVAKGFFVNALEEINKGLCYAPNNTESLGIFYSNRAHVLGDMRLFSEGLRSLQLAVENYYPECKLHELELKKEQFDEELKKIRKCDDHKFRLNLSHPPCPKHPVTIRDLRIENDCTFGRHIITDRDLEVGDVIAIEEPFAKVIQPQQRYKRCTHCLTEAPHLLVPCTGCTHAMFCSNRCQDNAWEYHKFECPMMEELMSLEHDQDVTRLALRIFLLTMRFFRNDIQQLRGYLDSNKGRNIHPFDLDHRSLCPTEKFLAYYNGNCTDAHLCAETREAHLRQAVLLAVLLGHHEVFAKQLECDKTKVYLIELLYHFICVNFNNAFELGSPSIDHEKVPTALGIYQCLSMASHSCSGNVVRLRDGAKLLWVVTHFIPSGSQIFDNYGPFFLTQTREQRQRTLKRRYGFDCKCEACLFDFPLADDLNVPPDLDWLRPSFLTDSGPVTVAKLKAELASVRDYITKNDCLFPCQQLRKAEVRLARTFRRATKDETMETKYPEFTTHLKYEDLVNEVDPWNFVMEDY